MAVIQRPTKGARISSFYPVHELPPLASLDSAFQLQEYISLLIRLNVHDVESIVSIPGKSSSHERDSSDGSNESAEKEGKGEVTVDESCWIYEQLRCVLDVSAGRARLNASCGPQATCSGPITPPHYHSATRMHSPDMPGDEGGRVVVLVCSSRQ